MWPAWMDHASSSEETCGEGTLAPGRCRAGPVSLFAVVARRGTKQGSDPNTNKLHVSGTRPPTAAITSGTDEATGINKHVEKH